jgi:hypothetical protein
VKVELNSPEALGLQVNGAATVSCEQKYFHRKAELQLAD